MILQQKIATRFRTGLSENCIKVLFALTLTLTSFFVRVRSFWLIGQVSSAVFTLDVSLWRLPLKVRSRSVLLRHQSITMPMNYSGRQVGMQNLLTLYLNLSSSQRFERERTPIVCKCGIPLLTKRKVGIRCDTSLRNEIIRVFFLH